MSLCLQCPRRCGASREDASHLGVCGVPAAFRVARIALHPYEEPCLCKTAGAGAVFFCGCSLRCVFCQNREISQGELPGTELTAGELTRQILALCASGADCIDLVTPTHYTEQLIPVLRELKSAVSVPIVWNSSGYESPDTLRRLEGLVDVYLPDCKYFSSTLSARLSGAPDYFPVAREALREMLRQVGDPVTDASGRLLRGVLVRHLVLPGHRQDSIDLLRALVSAFGPSRFLLSLMSQYTPDFAPPDCEPSLRRRITTFEYQSVLDEAVRLSLSGFSQSRSSSSSRYTPVWGEGVDWKSKA